MEEDFDLRGKKVLLVEDNKINKLFAVKIMNNWGISLEYAENGLEAVKMCEKNIFDLILMDIQMPVMDGYESTQKIRKLDIEWTTSVPIIALTAHMTSDKEKEFIDIGMNDHVCKPFNPIALKNKLITYLKD